MRWVSVSAVVRAGWLPSDGDFIVASCDDTEQQRATEPADRGANGHEGEEYQHAAIAFKACVFDDVAPGESGPDAKRAAAERAQHQTEQGEQGDFHECVSSPVRNTPGLV